MSMISEEGVPTLKVSFQITHIPLDEVTSEFGSRSLRENGRFSHSPEVKEGNKIVDFRCFSRIP